MKQILMDKKGAVSETLVWIAATIAIILIMAVFIFFSSAISLKTKLISIGDVKADVQTDVTSQKTSLAHILADYENIDIIERILENEKQK